MLPTWVSVFLFVCLILVALIGVASGIDALYVAEQKKRESVVKSVAESDEDEGFFTHAQVLADLPDDVLEGLGYCRTKSGSVRPAKPACEVVGEPYRAANGTRAVRLSCHCGWKHYALASAEQRIARLTAEHLKGEPHPVWGGGVLAVPLNVAVGSTQVVPFVVQTSRPERVRWVPTRPSPTRGERY